MLISCCPVQSCIPDACQAILPSDAALLTHVRVLQVFSLWFQMITADDKYFRRLYDKKLCCAGLLCLFGLPGDRLPAAIAGALDKVCATAIRSHSACLRWLLALSGGPLAAHCQHLEPSNSLY